MRQQFTTSLQARRLKNGEIRYDLAVRKKNGEGKWEFVGKTSYVDREAADLARAKFNVFAASGGQPGKGTLSEYLIGWADRREALGELELETLKGYRGKLRSAQEVIGHLPLSKVTAKNIRDWLDHLKIHGGLSGKPAAARSIKQARAILHVALADAVEAALIPTNPVGQLRRRKQDDRRPPAPVATRSQMREYLKAMVHDPLLLMFFQIGAFTGMRRSEIGALRWSNVSLDAGTIEVLAKLAKIKRPGEPAKWVPGPVKSARALRVLDMDEKLCTLLRDHRAAQLRIKMANRDVYLDQGFVIANEIGKPWSLDAVTKAAAKIRDDVGLPKDMQPTHVLRKFYATELHEAGTSDRVLQAMMGHASITTTQTHYLSARDEKRRAASRVIGDIL